MWGGGGQYVLSCDTLDVANGRRYPVFYVDKHEMQAGRHDLSFRLWINSDIDYLLIRFTADQPAPELDVESIMIKRRFRETFTYRMLQIFAVLFVIDGVLLVFWNRERLGSLLKKNIYIVMGLLAIFGISALPALMNCMVNGHDIEFHLSRIVGLAEGLETGQIPVRIQPGWCNDYGYAVSVFYGDILLYLPAMLYLLGVPLLYTYHIYLILIHLGTVGIAYYSYCRLCDDKYIGLFCTALTCLSVNRILNVYTRAAVGEYSAYMFFPLVIVGMKEILSEEGRPSQKTGGWNAWMLLGIGMTAILQTHILSFEMVCMILGIAVLFQIKRILHPENLWKMARAIALAIGMSAGFIVPFLDYAGQELNIFLEKWVFIQEFGLHIYELFSLTTKASGGAVSAEEGLRGRYPVSLGIVVMLLILLGVAAFVKLEWEEAERKRLLFVSGLAGVCIWLSTIYFPWNRCGKIPGVRDIAYSIQFPWRFLSLAIPLLAYAALLVLIKIKACVPWSRTKYLLLFLCGITALQGMYVTDLAVRSDSREIYDGSEMLREDHLMGAEYLFVDTDRKQMQEDAEIFGENIEIVNQTRSGNAFRITCRAEADAYLELPLVSYRYYRCVDTQDNTEFMITQGANNNIRVELPEHYRGTLNVFFEEPWHWRAAECISLLTVLLMGIYWCYGSYFHFFQKKCMLIIL